MLGEREHNVKRTIKYLLLICVVVTVLVGCGEEKKNQPKKEVKDLTITVFDQLEVSKEPLEEKDVSNVERGVREWASAFLAVNSDTNDKKLKDEALYNSIVDEKEREKLKEKRKKFYTGNTVNVEEVKVEVKDSKKAKYDKREVGVVECVIKVNGKKNDKKFNEKYQMKLIVDYIGDLVSVYEIESIAW